MKGEKIPKVYTPIKKSKINVSSNDNLRIDLKYEPVIPYGGFSLPIGF